MRAHPSLLLLLAACQPVDLIEPDVCGNGVLDVGEDCDRYPDKRLGEGTACGARGSGAGACRYVCSADDARCPTGWGCGADGVCRLSSGRFRAGTPQPAVGELGVIDADGDGIRDLVQLSSSRLIVRFGDGLGGFPTHVEISADTPKGPPGFGDLDNNGTTDIVIPEVSGLFVVLSGRDRSLSPVAYAPFELPRDQTLVLPVRTDLSTPFAEVVLVGTIANRLGATYLQPAGADIPGIVFAEGSAREEIAGRIAAVDLDSKRGAPGQELTFGLIGRKVVRVLGTRFVVRAGGGVRECQEPIDPNCRPQLYLRAEVELPGMLDQDGVRFADVNGDGDLDLLAAVEGRVAVALGDGDAHFRDLTGNNGRASFQDRWEALAEHPGTVRNPAAPNVLPPGNRWPIAAADLNGDDVADYVGMNGVFITARSGALFQTWTPAPDAWVDAVIGDFNRDGYNDIAAVNGVTEEITFLTGTGTGIFNPSTIATTDVPSMLRTGDFDGDLVTDLAFVENGYLKGKSGTSLSIVFGSARGTPSAPVSMGRLQFIETLEPAFTGQQDDGTLGTKVDLISDLIVVSSNELTERARPSASVHRSLAIMLGTSERRMLSPFTLGRAGLEPPSTALVGRYDPSGDTAKDILSYAQPRLWLVKGSGGAEFTANDAIEIAGDKAPGCAAEFHPECAVWATGDLENVNGYDEAVAVDHSGLCAAGRPMLRTFRASAGQLECTTFEVPGDLRSPHDAQLQDLDGDGKPDLLVAFDGFDLDYASQGSGNSVGPTGVALGAMGALIFWNDGGAFSASSMTAVPSPEGAAFLAAATAIQADDDPRAEIALATERGIFLADVGADRRVVVRKAAAFDGNKSEVLDFGRMYSADVDADGIQDLVLGQSAQVLIFTGKSAQPLGTSGESAR